MTSIHTHTTDILIIGAQFITARTPRFAALLNEWNQSPPLRIAGDAFGGHAWKEQRFPVGWRQKC